MSSSCCTACTQGGKACRGFESHVWRQDRCRSCGHAQIEHATTPPTTITTTPPTTPSLLAPTRPPPQHTVSNGAITPALNLAAANNRRNSAPTSSGAITPPSPSRSTSPRTPTTPTRISPTKNINNNNLNVPPKSPNGIERVRPPVPPRTHAATTQPTSTTTSTPISLPRPRPANGPPSPRSSQLSSSPTPTTTSTSPPIPATGCADVAAMMVGASVLKNPAWSGSDISSSAPITTSPQPQRAHRKSEKIGDSKQAHHSEGEDLAKDSDTDVAPETAEKRQKMRRTLSAQSIKQSRMGTFRAYTKDKWQKLTSSKGADSPSPRGQEGSPTSSPQSSGNNTPNNNTNNNNNSTNNLHAIRPVEQQDVDKQMKQNQTNQLNNSQHANEVAITSTLAEKKQNMAVEQEWQQKYNALKAQTDKTIEELRKEVEDWKRRFDEMHIRNRELQDELAMYKLKATTPAPKPVPPPAADKPSQLTPPSTGQPSLSPRKDETNASTPTSSISKITMTRTGMRPVPPDAVPSPPQPPPQPSLPTTTTPIPDVNNKTLTSMVKNAKRRMSGMEYRLSMMQRGGEVRQAQELDKRACVVKEILTSERSYMNCLTILIENYQKPLEAMFESAPAVASPSSSSASLTASLRRGNTTKRREGVYDVTLEDIKRVFYQLKVIHNFNSLLLSKLEERIESMTWTPSTHVGDIFVDMGDYLKVYTSYISNYMEALTTLKLCKQNDKFSAFLKKMAVSHVGTQFHGYQLEMFLITPIQRIPRYICLLKELKRYTDSSHPDHPLITSAIEIIERVAISNEKSHERKINISTLVALEKRFYNTDGGGEMVSLVEPHRIFLLEGDVMEVKRRRMTHTTLLRSLGANAKSRHLLLFNDLLIVAKKAANNTPNNNSGGNNGLTSERQDRRESMTVLMMLPGQSPIDEDQLECRAQFLVKDLSVYAGEDSGVIIPSSKDDIPMFTFKVVHQETIHCFAVQSEELRNKWLAEIRHSIEKICEFGGSGTSSNNLNREEEKEKDKDKEKGKD